MSSETAAKDGDLTLMKVARSGGQSQGTLMGWPLAPFTAPSQSPVPVWKCVSSLDEV